MIRFTPVFILSLGATTLLAACANGAESGSIPSPVVSSSGSSSPSQQHRDQATDVAIGLAAPWSVAFADSTPLISERDSARVLEATGDGDTREVGTIAGVQAQGEGGLLGIATHEEFLYAYYTAAEDNRVVRMELLGTPGALSLGPGEVVVDSIPKASTHNGGRIAFGPDGMLYVTVGDAGQPDRAQDMTSLSGKILRFTPEGAVPADNPYPNSAVYSLGHRNPQGIGWDEQGTMYATEFGQSTWDELNIIEPGNNYGWPTVEGMANRDGFTNPVQQWQPAVASPSGMTVAGDALYIANLRGERLRKVSLDSLDTSTELFVGQYGRLRDVVTAPDGALLILTNNTDGRGSPQPGDDRLLRFLP